MKKFLQKPLSKSIGIMLATALATGGLSALSTANATGGATTVSANNLGDMALIPYYTVRGNYVTGVHITNTSENTQVVKFRLRRATDSADALDINIVLSPYDMWTGYLKGDGTDVMLVPTDNSCTAPQLKSGESFFTAPDVNKAGADEGYIEIIGMGQPTTETGTGTTLAEGALHGTTGTPASCASVANNFLAANVTDNAATHTTSATVGETAYNSTGNVLKVQYFIRDGASGMEFGDNAVHFADFSDKAMMTNQQTGLSGGNFNGFDFPDLDGGGGNPNAAAAAAAATAAAAAAVAATDAAAETVATDAVTAADAAAATAVAVAATAVTNAATAVTTAATAVTAAATAATAATTADADSVTAATTAATAVTDAATAAALAATTPTAANIAASVAAAALVVTTAADAATAATAATAAAAAVVTADAAVVTADAAVVTTAAAVVATAADVVTTATVAATAAATATVATATATASAAASATAATAAANSGLRGLYDGEIRRLLGSSSILNDWSFSDSTNAATDWVITIPGQYLMVNPSKTDKTGVASSNRHTDLPLVATINVRDREEAKPAGGSLVVSPSPAAGQTIFPNEVNVIEWGGKSVFGASTPVKITDPGVTSKTGWASLSLAVQTGSRKIFNLATGETTGTAPTTAVPVLGFTAWQRTFTGSENRNYGRIIHHSRR